MSLFFYRKPRKGFCGCMTLLLILAAVLLCVLAAVGVAALVRQSSAQAAGAGRQFVVLVDQSNSVTANPPVRALATQVTVELITQMHEHASLNDVVSLVLFGTRMSVAVTPTALADVTLITRTQAALSANQSMGGTALADVLSNTLGLLPATTDVILVSDGAPSLTNESSQVERDAYAARLRALAAEYAQRHITLSILLIGPDAHVWAPMWQEVAGTDGGAFANGIYIEIASADDLAMLARASAQLMVSLAPSPTPLPTATPQPTHTSVPSATLPPATAMATAVLATTPTAAPISAATERAAASVTPTFAATAVAMTETLGSAAPGVSWGAVAAGAGLCVVGVLIVRGSRRANRRAKAAAAQPAPADEGVVEVYDAETDGVERVELRGLAVGEVWLIGSGPQCQIHLDCEVVKGGTETGELAALMVTEEGPRIESRGVPMYFDGRAVQVHRLFDGDHLYLDRFVLYYHNFFRQRVALDEES